MTLDNKITNDDIYKLLIHLIYELPSPQLNKKILFYVPYKTNPIELSEYNDDPISNYSIKSIIDYFSVENIIIIFNIILTEQKIIFVANDYALISAITQGFLNLIYPLCWINTYVPVISEDMLQYLQSFMPYIMGVEETLINKAKSYLDEDIIYIVNINKNTIDISNNKKSKKLDRKTLLKNIPEIPSEIIEVLITELKLLLKFCDENKNNINLILFNQTIKEIFIKSIVLMIGDYKKYVSYIDNIPLFNTDSFLINRPNKYKAFYTELSQSQLFRHFLHNDHIQPKKKFEFACKRFSIPSNHIRGSSSRSSSNKISSAKNLNIISNMENNTTTITLSNNLLTQKTYYFKNKDDSKSKISVQNNVGKVFSFN